MKNFITISKLKKKTRDEDNSIEAFEFVRILISLVFDYSIEAHSYNTVLRIINIDFDIFLL